MHYPKQHEMRHNNRNHAHLSNFDIYLRTLPNLRCTHLSFLHPFYDTLLFSCIAGCKAPVNNFKYNMIDSFHLKCLQVPPRIFASIACILGRHLHDLLCASIISMMTKGMHVKMPKDMFSSIFFLPT